MLTACQCCCTVVYFQLVCNFVGVFCSSSTSLDRCKKRQRQGEHG